MSKQHKALYHSAGRPDEEPGGEIRRYEVREDGRKYDLEERTARFAEALIRFAKEIPIVNELRLELRMH